MGENSLVHWEIVVHSSKIAGQLLGKDEDNEDDNGGSANMRPHCWQARGYTLSHDIVP